jgi:hypothetical protein
LTKRRNSPIVGRNPSPAGLSGPPRDPAMAPMPKSPQQSPKFPAASQALLPPRAQFGPPPVFDGEDAAAYEALLERVAGAVRPTDVLEEIWVRDVVDLAWDAMRLRRLRAGLMTVAAHEGVEAVLRPLLGILPAGDVATNWALRDRSTVKQVNKLLAKAGLTRDAVVAATLAARIDDFERIDRMITMAEALRAAALREVVRHREGLGRELNRALDAEDAVFEEVPTSSPAALRSAGADAGCASGRRRYGLLMRETT